MFESFNLSEEEESLETIRKKFGEAFIKHTGLEGVIHE
jgi:hypothetical protein